MTRIIDIDAMMPQDVTLRWRKQDWLLPGDLSVESVLAIQQAAQQLETASAGGDEQATIAAFQRLADSIAAVLAIRQPERSGNLTFGLRELGLLAGAIVSAMSGKDLPGQAEASEGNVETAASK